MKIIKNIELKETNIEKNEEKENNIIGSAVDNELLNGNAGEFNVLFSKAYRSMVSAFDFGGWTEYYDEDGLVVMTTQSEPENVILFDFGTGDEFRFKREGFPVEA